MEPEVRNSRVRATYRLQLGPELTLERARELVPYFRALGISHLYLSPVFQAREGSTHGYNVTDPGRISEALGGIEALRELRQAGLPIVLDVVPNHMAVDDSNPYWADEASRAKMFDLDPATGRHRRFFDVDELVGVRVEDPEVFAESHRLILDLVAEGTVDGVRVDHVDGLADPRGYLERLRGEGVSLIWVEKILEAGERLRDWPVQGTTGYEFAIDVQTLFVDPAGEAKLSDLAGDRPYREVAAQAKLEQAQTTFQPEIERLRRLADVELLEQALASLPVYRTYVEPCSGRVEQPDVEALAAVPAPIRRILLLQERGKDEFVTRFQQLTGALMAKGVEDTAFYRYVRLIALNEVGGDPSRFSMTVAEFHRANLERAKRHPNALLAGTTHDTKRSADVRARIGTLAGMAEDWAAEVCRWHDLNAGCREGGAPDWPEELLIYQTLIGAWPISAERVVRYVEKALHEEKRRTSWVDPDSVWDSAVARFCRGIYGNEEFMAAFLRFAERVAVTGERSAIGQLVLRLTVPGVPDIYNGDELWYLALVDPDNRRPVAWDRRADLLDALLAGTPPTRETVKLAVVQRLLGLRERRPEAFTSGYQPLPSRPGTCAFRRGEIVVAVPVRGERPEYKRPAGSWMNALDGIAEPLEGYAPEVLEPE